MINLGIDPLTRFEAATMLYAVGIALSVVVPYNGRADVALRRSVPPRTCVCSMVDSWFDSGIRLTPQAEPESQPMGNWPMMGGVNKWHIKAGPRPGDPVRTHVEESEWPKRKLDYLGRPLEQTLTPEQVNKRS